MIYTPVEKHMGTNFSFTYNKKNSILLKKALKGESKV